MRSTTSSSRHPNLRLRCVAAVIAVLAASLAVAPPAGAGFEARPLAVTPSASVLLVVGDLVDDRPIAPLDAQLVQHFGERGAVTVVADETLAPSDVAAADVVLLSSTTSASEFRPFLLKATVPVVALKASSWTALGLAPFAEDDATPLQALAELEVGPIDHPIVDGMEATLELFADGASAPTGRGWTTDTTPDAGPVVLATGPDGAALFVYEAGTRLDFPIVDESDLAAACRVGFPSHGGTLFSEDGLALLTRAVRWASSPDCGPAAGQPLTPSLDASMCFVDPAVEDRALVNGEVVDIDPLTGRPNLSSLWVRALAHDADADVLYVGGRFDRAYDADDRDPETGAPGVGIERDGLFSCDLTSGTVTDFEVPIDVDALGVTDAGSLNNDRVRALLVHEDHLYVGGRFRLGEGVDTGDLPVRGNGVHNLLRVDRQTGAIDTTWTVDVRGGVSALALHDGHLYVAGGIHTVGTGEGLAPAARLARLDLDTGAADPSFLPLVLPSVPQTDGNLFASVSALEVVGDTLVFGGSFDHVLLEPTADDWVAYVSTIAAVPATAWPEDRPAGAPRNSVAALDLSADAPTLTAFAPSLGDNNLAGGDVTAQIRDIASNGDDAVFVCGDWWLTHPEPGLRWTPYDADTPPEPEADAGDAPEQLDGLAEVDEVADPEAGNLEAADPAPEADDPDAALQVAADPNDPGWEGQRSLHQPRPNQHNIGRFDLATGASALGTDGLVWGATTDGGIQACDYDPASDRLFIGGHHESIGAFDPDFVDDPDVERYPDNHRPLEKVNAVDGTTGRVLEWDPDLNSVRGVDAVLVLTGGDEEPNRVAVGGAFDSADRMSREGLALYAIEPLPPVIEIDAVPGGLG